MKTPPPDHACCVLCHKSKPIKEFKFKHPLGRTKGYGKTGAHRMVGISKYCADCRPRPTKTREQKLLSTKWVKAAEKSGELSEYEADAAFAAIQRQTERNRALGHMKRRKIHRENLWSPLLADFEAELVRVRLQRKYIRKKLSRKGRPAIASLQRLDNLAINSCLEYYLEQLNKLKQQLKTLNQHTTPVGAHWCEQIDYADRMRILERFDTTRQNLYIKATLIEGPHFK